MAPRRSTRISEKPSAPLYRVTTSEKRSRPRRKHPRARPSQIPPPQPQVKPVFMGRGTLHLLRFPNEVLSHISKYLEPVEIKSLRQCNRFLASLLFPMMWATREKNHMSPLQWAAYNGDEPQIKTLLSEGYDVTAGLGFLWDITSPLTIAALRGHTTALKLMLDAGGDKITPNLWNPSFVIEEISKIKDKWSDELAELLFKHGAVVNGVTFTKKTLLHWLAEHKNVSGIRLLCKHGAMVTAKGPLRETPLHSAVLSGDGYETVRVLLQHGADQTICDTFGKTPLHWAVSEKNGEGLRSAKLLLAVGADINAVDFRGRTALHYVASPDLVPYRSGSMDLLLLLLEKGANTMIKDNEGYTAAGLAQKAEQMEFYRLITEKDTHSAI